MNEEQDFQNQIESVKREEEERLTKEHAEEIGFPYKKLSRFVPKENIVKTLPPSTIKEKRIFPFKKEGDKILVAITHPSSDRTKQAIKELKEKHPSEFKPVVVSESTMDYLIGFYEDFYASEQESKSTAPTKASSIKEASKEVKTAKKEDLLSRLIATAFKLDASDIHLQPEKDSVRVRFRVDGVLQDITELSDEKHEFITNRIKLKSDLAININDEAQDGSFSTEIEGTNIDIRVSIIPTNYGESVVMRLLPQTATSFSLDSLGLTGHSKEVLSKVITQPNGLILNTGPTGSGKTTTLYAILNELNDPDVKIITLENPIEYQVEGLTQREVDPEKEGQGFSEGLEDALRQDPDIILVGEIRNKETANTAIQASQTGHLVLSTLHTNDAAGALPRLKELGVEPKFFADSILAVIAQRLVRTLNTEECPPEEEQLTGELQKKIKKLYQEIPEKERETRLKSLPDQIKKPGNCDDVLPYKGRTAIFETLTVTPEIDSLIGESATVSQIREAAKQSGMVTMEQDGLIKALNGETTLSEVERVTQLSL